MFARLVGYFLLTFLGGTALAAAAWLAPNIPSLPNPVLGLLGLLCCLAGAAVAAILAFALFKTRLRSDFQAAAPASPETPAPARTPEELKAERAAAAKAYALAKTRYRDVLTSWRQGEDTGKQTTRAEVAEAREAMMSADERKIELTRAISALAPVEPEEGKTLQSKGAA